MANGKGKGCLANGLLALLVVAFAVGAFVFGGYVEHETGAMFGGSSRPAAQEGPDGQDAPEQEAAAEAAGTVLYDGEGMKVEFGGLENVDAAGVSILSLVVENKTGQDVSCIAEMGTLSVNGFNIDPVGGAEIQAGKSAVAQFTLSHKQANIAGTDGIEDVAMNLEFVVLGSSVDVVAEAPISIAF